MQCFFSAHAVSGRSVALIMEKLCTYVFRHTYVRMRNLTAVPLAFKYARLTHEVGVTPSYAAGCVPVATWGVCVCCTHVYQVIVRVSPPFYVSGNWYSYTYVRTSKVARVQDVDGRRAKLSYP